MKKKRPYHRPAYKKIAEYWRGEYEVLQHECEGLKKKVKSLQMENQAVIAGNKIYGNRISGDCTGFGPTMHHGETFSYSTFNPFVSEQPKPLYNQPKKKAWWQWW